MANKIIDKSLSFGLQNFIFSQGNETDVTYNYYGFMNKLGSILIMRTTKDAMEAKYFIGVGVFATIWDARAAKTYVLPNELENQTF